MKKLTTILFILSLGCAKEEEKKDLVKDPPKKKLEELVDESSLEERQVLAENMAAIQSYATAFAIKVDFSSVPILVTTKNEQMKKGNGLCVYDGRKGMKIYIKKDFFMPDIFDKDTGFSSNLFNLLVHEIGHCYLLRKHEHTSLYKEGFKAKFRIENSKGTFSVSYYSVPASMMVDDDSFRIPRILEKYYVGEIFGKFRAKNLDELQTKYGFELVPE